MSVIKLCKGDCLVESDKIEDGSVDLILTDLPYGTVKGLGNSRVAKEKKYNVSEWDNIIDTEKIMNIANRILRKNGKMVLTANQPFTTELISKAIPNLPHCYNMYWDKMHFSNCLISNKAPVSYIEDILVFSKKESDLTNPVKAYTNRIKDFINKPNKEIFEDFNNNGYKKYAVLDTFNSDKARRYNFLTLETFINLESLYKISSMNDFKEWEYLNKIHRSFEDGTPSVFNLWEGKKYKSNILKYKKDYNGYHPTQKPVLLLEDLIKTFSNEGDLVVDLTMGSGSTGVACVNTNRNFTGIELGDNFFDIACTRIYKDNDTTIIEKEDTKESTLEEYI